jgi:uncharacterized FAD-dependent dehydrogenase
VTLLKVTNIRVPVGESIENLPDFCARVLKIPRSAIGHYRILRKSLDIRNKHRLEHVYTAAVEVADEKRAIERSAGRARPFEPQPFEPPSPGTEPLEHPPVVVGAGPAGLLAAHQLASMGYRPIVIERGRSVRERTRDVRAFDRGAPFDEKSNYLFGEGGAGTFSDGKLTCRNTGPDTDRVLEILASAKGKPSILYEAKPHLGSNRLPAVVKALRQQILDMGGTIQFDCRLERLDLRDGRVVGLETSTGYLPANVVLLGIGHSARDTIEMLSAVGVPIEFKPFQMGVRIEQSQDRVTQVQFGTGWQAKLLGPADYTMNVRAGDREVFSFCMCAGGYIMPSVSQEGYFCTNGMSRSFHESPFANSGIVVTVGAEDVAEAGFGTDPLAGIRYQSAIEKKAFELAGGDYASPIQWASDFIDARATKDPPPSSYPRGVRPMNLGDFLPGPVAKVLVDGLLLMDRQWSGRFLAGATLVGPEARGSCPVRFPRDLVGRESTGVAGLYPMGEGAGYAGGIVSAAVDGLRSAKAVITRYSPSHR